MNPLVHVLYQFADGTLRFEQREAQGRMSSTDPIDFGLPGSITILLVLHKAQYLNAFVKGAPARG